VTATIEPVAPASAVIEQQPLPPEDQSPNPLASLAEANQAETEPVVATKTPSPNGRAQRTKSATKARPVGQAKIKPANGENDADVALMEAVLSRMATPSERGGGNKP
jgi:hypothetical protein